MKSTGIFALGAFALGAGLGLASGARRTRRRFSFYGRSVLITGGSRGLGLVLARELARQRARLALLARDEEELQRASAQLQELGAEVFPQVCDVCRREQVEKAVAALAQRFGKIDMLINNAGVIQVGPFDHMQPRDFEEALAVHLFAPLYATLAVLPHMRRAGGGRVVNIASVGGKIAMPHLLPYTVSKFALVGLSDGLRSELLRENILVTTVCPGLMRTGSTRHAIFKGRHRREYAWFAISDSLPFLSVSAERAARQIVEAARRGAPRLVIGVHTKAAVLLNELFPGASAAILSLANRALPKAGAHGTREGIPGHQSESAWAPSWLTRLNQRAAKENNQLPFNPAGAS